MGLNKLEQKCRWQEGVGPNGKTKVKCSANASIVLMEHLLMVVKESLQGLESSKPIQSSALGMSATVLFEG